MIQVDAVVLAGARNTGRLREMDESFYEASIEIAGRPMVYYVLDALAAVPEIRRIMVVAPPGAFPYDQGSWQGKVSFTRAGESLLDNIRRGIDALDTGEKVLVVTSDIPLINPGAVSDFILRCQGREADIYYPIISRDVNDHEFPGVKRTYFRLREGVFTGGNMALVSPSVFQAYQPMIEHAISMRKNPWKLSRLLGLRFIVKFMFKQLSIGEIESRVEDILQFRGVGVISPYPQVGIDVDKPSDLQLARQMLEAMDSHSEDSMKCTDLPYH
ncbi:MAG: NTP transferase domain-containing protein [Firmicutes bacterium]|nr:NTP transferase domain-containing protein [Bacillota bacterium]